MKVEGPWLGNGFSDFVENIPNEHLLNQLYMFSASFDKQEAFDRSVSIERYFFTDDFNEGVSLINQDLRLSLEPIHMRKTNLKQSLSGSAIRVLRDRLSAEYEFLDMLRKHQCQK